MAPAPRHPSAGSPSASNASDRARRRRVAAERAGREARILVCERRAKGPLRKLLRQLHLSTVVCHDLEDALRQIAEQPVEVAVVAMEQDEECLGLLQLLRRALPKTPIVLVLEDPTPAARLATLTVRPFYVAVPPVGAEEMAAVLRDALAASRRKK